MVWVIVLHVFTLLPPHLRWHGTIQLHCPWVMFVDASAGQAVSFNVTNSGQPLKTWSNSVSSNTLATPYRSVRKRGSMSGDLRSALPAHSTPSLLPPPCATPQVLLFVLRPDGELRHGLQHQHHHHNSLLLHPDHGSLRAHHLLPAGMGVFCGGKGYRATAISS